MREEIDRRYLGAIRPIDRVTGMPVNEGLKVKADEARLFRNRSGIYVIDRVLGLEQHYRAFPDPPDPPATSDPPADPVRLRVSIRDPRHVYLPRLMSIPLPRSSDPEAEDNVFEPVLAKLYPSHRFVPGVNWSTLRCRVKNNGEPVTGALIRVVRFGDGETPDTDWASGISIDGEALVAVMGVPITDFASASEEVEDEDSEEESEGESEGENDTDEVVISEVPVRVEVSYALGTKWPLDPDELEQAHAGQVLAQENRTLRTGRMERVSFNLNLST